MHVKYISEAIPVLGTARSADFLSNVFVIVKLFHCIVCNETWQKVQLT